MQNRHIIAMGGGGFLMEPDNLLLNRYVIQQARISNPTVCFLPTASGDPDASVTVTLQDSTQPSFAVTYPALVVTRDGDESVKEQNVEGVLSQGVSWIVRKVFRFGFVPPEGYHHPPGNAGRPHHQ
jgi:hypothetical protein